MMFMKEMTLVRLKHTAKLEKMIEEGWDYKQILKQSRKLDKFITYEMKRRNTYQTIDKSE